MPLISIIIPVFNVKEYLRRCLDSIIRQTLKDLEIICIDDGSIDGSEKILTEYSLKDSRIKIIHKENDGVSSARNDGLKLASAEYIGFVDADDWIEPETYESAYKAMKDYGTDLVCYYAHIDNHDLLPDNQELHGTINYHAMKRVGLYNVNDDIVNDNTVTVWNKLFKKSIIKQYNISFPAGFTGEDMEFFYKYAVMCKNIYYMGAYLYHYTQRSTSAIWQTYEKKDKKIINRIQVGYNIYAYFLQYSLVEKFNNTLITVFFWSCFRFDYFYTDIKNRPLVLKYTTQLVKEMNLSLIRDNHDLLKNLERQKYYAIPGLGIRYSCFKGSFILAVYYAKKKQYALLINYRDSTLMISLSIFEPLFIFLKKIRKKLSGIKQ